MTLPLPINTSMLPDMSPKAASADVATPGVTTPGSNYTDISGLEALKSAPKSPAALAKVAQQVEAMFLQMMLKSMRDASPGDGIFDSNEGRMYQDMFDKQIALDMSRREHVGIGDMLLRQLTQKSLLDNAAAAPPPRALSSHALAATPEAFIASVLPSIKRAAKKIGVSPEAMLAQAALETGWGRRVARTADGASSFNLFGVKAGANWTGPKVLAGTVEFDGTVAKRNLAAFRAYGSIEQSVEDFARLLSNAPRYRETLAAGADAQAYVRALGDSGYATDPDYANKLKQILESDRLRSAFGARTAGLQK